MRLNRVLSVLLFESKPTWGVFLEGVGGKWGRAPGFGLRARGGPTEEVLAKMRAANPPVHYLVGTPKGRLTRLEKHLLARPWQEARTGVQSLPQRRLGSSCWRKRASSTSWPKAATVSPKSGRCGGDRWSGRGGAASTCRRCGPPAERFRGNPAPPAVRPASPGAW